MSEIGRSSEGVATRSEDARDSSHAHAKESYSVVYEVIVWGIVSLVVGPAVIAVAYYIGYALGLMSGSFQ